MNLVTLIDLAGTRHLPLLLSLSRRLATPVYRAAFLAAASRSGVLRRLAVRPCDLDTLASAIGVTEDRRLLRAWLDVGVRLGDLGFGDGCYRLRSRTARALADPANDAVAAALEEVARFHLPVLLNAPSMLRGGRRLTLGDQDGAVIARSTRVVQPFVQEAIRDVLDRRAPLRLLEVGCGSGIHVRYAAGLNPRLTALAIDLQEDVAAEAEANLAAWGLAGRVRVRRADLRDLDTEPQFDLVTMHNNIYYFPTGERTKVLEHARSLLAPGGRILLTTPCPGGSAGMQVLDLWFRYADFGGPLPRPEELADQLRCAGFTGIRARRLIPGEQFRAFVGVNRTPAPVPNAEERNS
ncbi:SAM-dependent methyltransferase [Actinomadura rubrisoli]|uniref:Class I SAM-dependent methyltransferase n=1 Tax=Actinomadura rubrisoli TaxID=2530368 RepID=A0A4V2YWB0_9ACTN|nr:class I SAM-dependent methyltransferase [Actinomadura rubrisoli]TDD84657.1 class I SAM-dependent methyltransferase [Actinomadura rubrisoli]